MIWERHRVSSFKCCDVLQMMTFTADRKYLSNYLSKYRHCSINQQIWKYLSMEISDENALRRTGIIKWRRRSAEIGERRGLWNSIDLRALPGLCHPCRRRCTQSQDQGFGIWDVQSISSHFVRRNILQIPKKKPPPDCGIAATAAAPSPNISCTHDLSPPVSDCCTPRSENAAILWQFFCMIRFWSQIAADFCLTCTSLVQSALASDLRNDFSSSQ